MAVAVLYDGGDGTWGNAIGIVVNGATVPIPKTGEIGNRLWQEAQAAGLPSLAAVPKPANWDANQVTADNAGHPERTTMRQQAVQFVIDCNTYAALASPTTAQTSAFAKRVAQAFPVVLNWLVKVNG